MSFLSSFLFLLCVSPQSPILFLILDSCWAQGLHFQVFAHIATEIHRCFLSCQLLVALRSSPRCSALHSLVNGIIILLVTHLNSWIYPHFFSFLQQQKSNLTDSIHFCNLSCIFSYFSHYSLLWANHSIFPKSFLNGLFLLLRLKLH